MPIIFCLFILFCLWLSYELKKGDKARLAKEKQFWEREHNSNFVKKQSTDELTRITLPEYLPFHNDTDNQHLKNIEEKIKKLSSVEIINLTGYTNTDLKYKYGTSNLDYLTTCDNNFIHLVSNLNQWSAILYDLKLYDDCKIILDFAISIKADASDIYLRRANICVMENDSTCIDKLIDSATELTTIRKDYIIDKLNEIMIELMAN